jgi:hypothetical protein
MKALTGPDPIERDTAAARLAIVGPRAVGPLVEALEYDMPHDARAAMLRVLEAIRDPRAVSAAAAAVDDDDEEVAIAAVGTMRPFLRWSDSRIANAVFERLTAVVLDSTRGAPVRTAALEALSDLSGDAVRKILEQLEDDPLPDVRALATHPDRGARPQMLAEIAASNRCPDPLELRAGIAEEGARVPLNVLGRLLDTLRERESAETATPRRTEWQACRAAVHQALAARGSRLGIYDLRETLASVPGPLPVGFLAALNEIGNASCLEPIAATYARAFDADDRWWVEHLRDAFQSIVKREKLTARSAPLKRIVTKYPHAANLSSPARSTQRSPRR